MPHFPVSALLATALAFPLGAPSGSSAGTYVALGDSITAGLYATAADRTYVALVARGLGKSPDHFLNLGTGGAYALTIWNEEIPRAPRDASLVTLFIGVNDERTTTNRELFVSGGLTIRPTLEYWRVALRRIVDGIRAAAPRARIVVANLPNLAFYPAYLARHDAQWNAYRALLTQTADAMNTSVNALASENIVVVDLRCDPEMYRADNFADIVHPNDRGYAHLAERFLEAIASPHTPLESCPPYS